MNNKIIIGIVILGFLICLNTVNVVSAAATITPDTVKKLDSIPISINPDLERPFQAEGIYKANFRKKGTSPDVLLTRDKYSLSFDLKKIQQGQKVIKNLISSDVKHKGSKLTYSIDDIDLTYEALPKKLKEEIIIPKTLVENLDPSGTLDFTGVIETDLRVRIGNTTYSKFPEHITNVVNFTYDSFEKGVFQKKTKTIYDSIAFLDEENKTVFYFPKPVAYDAAGSEKDLIFEFKRDNGRVEYSLKISVGWLLDESRVYPVVIDPTTIIPTGDDIYINEDTKIEPGTYHIIDGNDNGVLIINCDNCTLDCQGATFIGDASYGSFGIYNGGYNEVKIKNCNLESYGSGIIYAYGADEGDIKDNTIKPNNDFGSGIIIFHSDSSNIISNEIRWGNCGIGLRKSSNNLLEYNTCKNNDAAGIVIDDESSNNKVRFNEAKFTYDGWGIIISDFSDYNLIENNNPISHNRIGIGISENSFGNTIKTNTITDNDYGFYHGPYRIASSGNYIYNNYFDNDINTVDEGSNYWNIGKQSGTNIIDGPYLGGNYWSDYEGVDTNGDGLGDTELPYTSNGNIQSGGDWLPLVTPAALPDLALTQGDISFSPEKPKRERTVTIKATIHNTGDGKAEDILVKLYDGNPDDGGIWIGNDRIASIAADGDKTAQVNWDATFGSHEIYVVIDPDNAISEINEGNNKASKQIIVATYKVLVVATFYKDESLSDIEQYESGLNERLEDTKEYYLEQSYGDDYIWFSEPVYVQIGDSWAYPDFYIFDDHYSPPRMYADSTISALWTQKGIDSDEYDAIIGYQTNIQGDYRAVAVKDLNFAALNIDDNYGTFAHELGHALYGFDDLYATGIPLFENPGDIDGWGLMGEVAMPPAPIILFNKVLADWLEYDPTMEVDLTEPKTFKLTSLEDMNYGDDVVKIESVDDPGIDFSYDFILEARKRYPTVFGIVIYQNHHGWLGSFLENIPSSNPVFIHPKQFPTLEEGSPIYRHIPTGLKFQYLSDTNPDPDTYEPKIKVGFNVSENANMTGTVLNNLNMNSASINSTLRPPIPPYTIVGFSVIVPLDTGLTEEGKVLIVLVNEYDKPSTIKSIKIVNFGKKECVVITPLPITLDVGSLVKIETEKCTLPDDNRASLNVEIVYDIISANGTISPINHTSKGNIFITAEKQVTDIYLSPSMVILYSPFIFLILSGLVLIIKYRKNKKTVILLFVTLIVLLFVLVYIYSSQVGSLAPSTNPQHIGQFASAATPNPNPNFESSYAPLANMTYPDLDLHAYTDTGLHVGINYETGIYENQIPGAVSSGDLIAEEWIFVPSNLNVRFVVDSYDVQQYLDEINSSETLITNYSVLVMEYGENPEVVVIDDNVIITDRTVSKPVISTIGPDEQDAVMVPEWIKEHAISKLEAIQTDNRYSQKEIDEAIKHVNKSLETIMWIDQLHLDAKHGHTVFDEEKKAVKHLMKITNGEGKHYDPEIVDNIQEVIDDLVKADEQLTKIAIEDAKNTQVEDPKKQKKVDHEIEKAEEKLDKAYEKLDKEEPDKAIDHFKKAWRHAQLAMKHAIKPMFVSQRLKQQHCNHPLF